PLRTRNERVRVPCGERGTQEGPNWRRTTLSRICETVRTRMGIIRRSRPDALRTRIRHDNPATRRLREPGHYTNRHPNPQCSRDQHVRRHCQADQGASPALRLKSLRARRRRTNLRTQVRGLFPAILYGEGLDPQLPDPTLWHFRSRRQLSDGTERRATPILPTPEIPDARPPHLSQELERSNRCREKGPR